MGSNATTLEVLIQIREELAGLRKTRTELQGAKTDANQLGDAIKSGLGIGTGMQMVTMAVGLAVAAIKSTVGEAINLSEQLKDTSEALGISTTELQVFRLELQDAGMDVGRLSMAIAEQTRSLAEARDSGSAAAQAYRALGLSAASVERLTVGERVLAVVRAYGAATDKSVAFTAATQILGGRELPRLMSALEGLATKGVPAVTALRDAQGRLLSPEAIAQIDAAKKQWEGFWGSIVVGSGEALAATSKFYESISKPTGKSLLPSWDVAVAKPTGVDQGAQFESQVRRRNPGTPAPSFWDIMFARETPGAREQIAAEKTAQKAAAAAATPEAIAAAKAAADKKAADDNAAKAQANRLLLTNRLTEAQAGLAAIQANAATAEANEALTVEEKAAEKKAALADEIAKRQEIIDIMVQTQAAGDFRPQAEKDAEMAKEQVELQRAQNALAAAGNTAAQQQARELFRLETEAIAAEAAGNTKIAEQQREQIKALQLTAQLEGQAPALVQARITAERELTEAQRTRAAQELDFSRRIGDVDQAVALIEADNALTESERRAKIIPLLAEQNRLIRARIALLEQDTRLQQGDQTALDLQKTIDDLRKQLSETQAKAAQAAGPETLAMRDAKGLRDLGDPSQHYQSVDAGAAGAGKSFIAQIGTDGDIAASAISSGLNSALSDSVSWMQQLANGAITFQEFWSGAIGYVGQMFQRMAIEMVAKMLWRSTVERALVWLGVTTHVQGEATKTAATTTGVGMRVLLGIKEALVSVYKGALYAFEALANIPYVGPFLGAAAMAAAIAGGIALVSKIGHEQGGYTANVGTGEVAGVVHGKEWVAPAWMLQDARFAPIIGMLEGARTGSAAAADLLGADVTGGIAAPVLAMQQAAAPAAGAGGSSSSSEPLSLHVGVMSKQQQAAEFFSSAQGQKVLIDANRATARLYG